MSVGAGEQGTAPARRPGTGVVTLVVVGSVLLVAVVMRFATRSDLWLDEALSVNIARLPVGDIPDALRRDGAPPLYYFLLHFWMSLFGEGDIAVRALSGICSLATFPAIYFAGRRLGGRTTAWVAVLVWAVSPFAIRYATETRMYALVMLLVTWGYLAFVRALERPSWGRLVLVALVTTALLYSHNWSWYLLATVGAFALGLAWRTPEPERRRAARRIAAAMVVGGVCYLPWVPTLLDQLAKTGTPWADARLPWSGIMDVFDGLGGVQAPIHGEALFLRSVLTVLALLGVFAVGVDARHLDVDLRTRPTVRWEAAVAVGTLVVGLTLSWLGGTAFVSRYSSVVVPLLLLVVTVGIMAFVGGLARAIVLAVVVVVGLAGGVRNVVERRTQAHEVAAVLAAEARPGDVVVYCPDQLGPSVHRILGDDRGLVEVTFPALRGPERVDWVDYRERIDAADTGDVAERVLARADGARVWYVISPGYRSVEGRCEELGAALAVARPGAVLHVEPDDSTYFEFMGLTEFPAE